VDIIENVPFDAFGLPVHAPCRSVGSNPPSTQQHQDDRITPQKPVYRMSAMELHTSPCIICGNFARASC